MAATLSRERGTWVRTPSRCPAIARASPDTPDQAHRRRFRVEACVNSPLLLPNVIGHLDDILERGLRAVDFAAEHSGEERRPACAGRLEFSQHQGVRSGVGMPVSPGIPAVAAVATEE